MSIHFVKITSPDPVSAYLAETIGHRLEVGENVLWLLSGGSAIAVAVTAARLLVAERRPLANLTVSLVDERYGPPGHSNSNWQQLLAAGLDLPDARLQPVLTGASFHDTATAWATQLERNLDAADYSLELLGIGPDGHISGIKPHSPALTAAALTLAYSWEDYERLTTTPAALARLDETVVYAVGENKHSQLENLALRLGPVDQPAQLLKNLPAVAVYNDYEGDPV